jgi:hypothetical protein
MFQVQEFTRRRGHLQKLKVFTQQAHVLVPQKVP